MIFSMLDLLIFWHKTSVVLLKSPIVPLIVHGMFPEMFSHQRQLEKSLYDFSNVAAINKQTNNQTNHSFKEQINDIIKRNSD